MSDIHNEWVKPVQDSLLHVIEQDLKAIIQDSQYYGIIDDESTGVSIHKILVIYVRYVSEGEMNTELLGSIRIADGKAETRNTKNKEHTVQNGA